MVELLQHRVQRVSLVVHSFAANKNSAWDQLLDLPRNRYPRLCYEMLMYFDNLGFNNWASDVRLNLYRNGFGYVWEEQIVISPKLF